MTAGSFFLVLIENVNILDARQFVLVILDVKLVEVHYSLEPSHHSVVVAADIRVHEFFKTAYFMKGIHPIPGAYDALLRLSTFCSLSVVTSRQNAIKDHTIEWLNLHYPDLFDQVHFGNHFALDGKSRPKSEICRSLGAQVLIDDNPKYAAECAEVGIRVLLFDYHNSYPWCKSGSVDLHPLVTKVHNWEEVERCLAPWIVPQLSPAFEQFGIVET